MTQLPIPQDIAAEIVRASQKLYARGLVANHDGNITFRLYDGFFAATPTAYSKGDITKEDLLIVDAQGQVVAGKHKVFSEISWHLALYRARPDIACVVHAHPVTASAYALAGRDLGTPAIPEAVVSLGRHILTTAFFSPTDKTAFAPGGSFEDAARTLLAESDGLLVPGNGAWAVGQSVMQTYYRMELIEHVAQQHHGADQMGELRRLSPALVTELLARRPAKAGPPGAGAGKAAAGVLPALKPSLPEPSGGPINDKPTPAGRLSANADDVPGLTPAELKEIVRAELEEFLR